METVLKLTPHIHKPGHRREKVSEWVREKKSVRKKLRSDDKGSERPPYSSIEYHTALTGENRQAPGSFK